MEPGGDVVCTGQCGAWFAILSPSLRSRDRCHDVVIDDDVSGRLIRISPRFDSVDHTS